MMAKDWRGTSLLFRGALVALGRRIIPEGATQTHVKLPLCEEAVIRGAAVVTHTQPLRRWR